jgi:hypothetical protein
MAAINCRFSPEEKTRLVGRITVFENKIKSKLKGQAVGFRQISVF